MFFFRGKITTVISIRNVYFFNFLKIDDNFRVWIPWSKHGYWPISAPLLYRLLYNPIVYINRDVNGWFHVDNFRSMEFEQEIQIYIFMILFYVQQTISSHPTRLRYFQHPGSGCNLISCSHVSFVSERGGVALSADKTLAMRLTKHLFLRSNSIFFLENTFCQTRKIYFWEPNLFWEQFK